MSPRSGKRNRQKEKKKTYKRRRNGRHHTILDYYILYRIKKASACYTVRDTSRLEQLLLAMLSYRHASLTGAQILKPSGNL